MIKTLRELSGIDCALSVTGVRAAVIELAKLKKDETLAENLLGGKENFALLIHPSQWDEAVRIFNYFGLIDTVTIELINSFPKEAYAILFNETIIYAGDFSNPQQ